MRRTLVTLALAGTVGLTGAALLAPGSALAQTADGTPRITALKDALKGLVGDGTLTQEQADEVASVLADRLPPRGDGGHGHGRAARLAQEEVAEVLGVTVQELREQRRAGRTLAQIAETEGVSREQLVDGLIERKRKQWRPLDAEAHVEKKAARTFDEQVNFGARQAARAGGGVGFGARPQRTVGAHVSSLAKWLLPLWAH